MIFTIETLAHSLADYLAPELPGVAFYSSPSQQGSQPAMFLRLTNARIAKKIGGRLLRTLGLDLVCTADFNQTDLDDQYVRIADTLDQMIETFPYCGRIGEESALARTYADVAGDNLQTALLRTYERRWDIVDSVLHYKFDLKLWVSKAEDALLMQSIESYNEEVT